MPAVLSQVTNLRRCVADAIPTSARTMDLKIRLLRMKTLTNVDAAAVPRKFGTRWQGTPPTHVDLVLLGLNNNLPNLF